MHHIVHSQCPTCRLRVISCLSMLSSSAAPRPALAFHMRQVRCKGALAEGRRVRRSERGTYQGWRSRYEWLPPARLALGACRTSTRIAPPHGYGLPQSGLFLHPPTAAPLLPLNTPEPVHTQGLCIHTWMYLAAYCSSYLDSLSRACSIMRA